MSHFPRIGRVHPAISRHSCRVLLLACLSTLLVALSCTPGGDVPDDPLVLRFIDGETGSSRGVLDVYREEEVFSWGFDSEAAVEPWIPGRMDMAFRQEGEGLFMRSSSNDPYVVREGIDLDTAQIDTIRIRHSWLDNTYIQIFWASHGEMFSEEKSSKVEGVDDRGQLEPTYTFKLRDHPEWQGTIQRFRFDPTIVPERRLMIFWIEGVRQVLDAEKLAAAIAKPGMVDLEGESRLALPAPPGYAHERSLKIPEGSDLNLAIGLQQAEGPAVTFRAFLDQGKESTEIYSRTLDPASEGGRWFDESIPLPATGRKEATLRLVTEGPEPEELTRGLPLWGHPEVWQEKPAPADQPNVVLILLDTLRADRLSLYGHERQTTPNLDRWAAERAVVFENAVAPAPWTLPSHASLFTGMDAVRHGANYGDAVADSLDLLAERLRREGWQTAAFTGGGYVRPAFGLAQGFERFSYWRDVQRPDDKARVGGDLDASLEQALAWLDGQQRSPFFLFFHTYETHAPYSPEQPWYSDFAPAGAGGGQGLFMTPRPGSSGEEGGWRYDAEMTERIPGQGLVPIERSRFPILSALYDSSVAKADAAVGQILERLDSLGLRENTIVIITSDHGEALGEKGKAGHAFLYDFNLMVPLIVALPDGRGAGQRVPAQVRLIDVAPTVAELTGLTKMPGADGASLLPYWQDPERQAPRVAESYAGSSNWGMSLRTGNRWKYTFQHSPWRQIHGQEELFDLEKDPDEVTNLAAEESELRNRFRKELVQRFEARASHLVLQAQNTTEHQVVYKFRSTLASTLGVKATSLPWCQAEEEACVDWVQGWAVITLSPGESATLYLEGSPFCELKMDLQTVPDSRRDAHQWKHGFQVDELLDGPLRVHLGDQGWEILGPGRGLEAGATGLEMQWKNSVWDDAVEGATDVDEEARKQLEALGYAN